MISQIRLINHLIVGRKRGGMTRRGGFTLIELLLVLVIIGVVTAVTIPEFVRSMRGNRLRTAARTVVAAGRYARSMAVLHQRAIAIEFQIDGAQLVVDAFRPAIMTNATETTEVPVIRDDRSAAEAPTSRPSATGPGMNIRLERMLDQVTITEVVHQQPDPDADNSSLVIYQSNGRCTPYRVRVEDQEGEAIEIKVDSLGSPELVRRKFL